MVFVERVRRASRPSATLDGAERDRALAHAAAFTGGLLLVTAPAQAAPAAESAPVSLPLAAQPLAPPPLRPCCEGELATKDVGDVLTSIFGGRAAPPPPTAPTGAVPLSLSLLPNIWASPAAGLALGAALVGGFRAGPAATTTMSSLFTSLVLTTEGQTISHLKHMVFTSGNEWLLSGDLRYADMSQDTFGLGTATRPEDAYTEHFKLGRVHERVYRRLVGALYLGVGFELDHHFEIREEGEGGPSSSPRALYEGTPTSTTSAGLTTQVVMDSRDSTIRPTRGSYAEAGFHAYPTSFGGSRPWQSFHGEARLYTRLGPSPRHVLAFWGYAWVSLGQGPYLDLPSLGWDMFGRTGRGYVQGRFRGQSQLYVEGEYRVSITEDGFLGAVAFANASAFSRPPANTFDGVAFAAGGGLRVMLMKQTSTNLALDAAWGEQSSGVYFNASEAF